MASPRAILKPLTPEARAAAGRDEIAITQLPFRVGRESRLGMRKGHLEVMERRKLDHGPNNECYLVDAGQRLNISREHFQIEADGNGGYLLVDRGSACGTVVGATVLGGGDKGGRCALKHGNVIVVGTAQSPYIYKFLTAEG